jgi:L-ascorbate metabolism protein UlaG (beta-lactamase superfamily)
MIITRFGHAALLVEVAGARILIDPGTYSTPSAFALDDLDAIVVTHQHADHADPARLPRLLEVSPGALVLAEEGAIRLLPELAARASSLGPGAELDVGGATIRGVGARHAIIHPDLPSVGNVGVAISAPQEPTLLHPGDAYQAAPDRVDVLALPVAAPWAKLGETVEFVRRVGATTVVPIHDAGLSEVGYPVYRRTIESLGGAARFAWLAPTETLALEG